MAMTKVIIVNNIHFIVFILKVQLKAFKKTASVKFIRFSSNDSLQLYCRSRKYSLLMGTHGFWKLSSRGSS